MRCNWTRSYCPANECSMMQMLVCKTAGKRGCAAPTCSSETHSCAPLSSFKYSAAAYPWERYRRCILVTIGLCDGQRHIDFAQSCQCRHGLSIFRFSPSVRLPCFSHPANYKDQGRFLAQRPAHGAIESAAAVVSAPMIRCHRCHRRLGDHGL